MLVRCRIVTSCATCSLSGTTLVVLGIVVVLDKDLSPSPVLRMVQAMTADATFDWESSLAKHLAIRLKEHCDRTSIQEVAEAAGLSRGTLYKYLRCEILPGAAALFALERSLNISLWPVREVLTDEIQWERSRRSPKARQA